MESRLNQSSSTTLLTFPQSSLAAVSTSKCTSRHSHKDPTVNRRRGRRLGQSQKDVPSAAAQAGNASFSLSFKIPYLASKLWEIGKSQAVDGFDRSCRKLWDISPFYPKKEETEALGRKHEPSLDLPQPEVIEIKSKTPMRATTTLMETQESGLIIHWTGPGASQSRLVMLHLKNLESDEQLFEALRKVRGRTSCTRHITTVKSVGYVKINVCGVPRILHDCDLPPADRFDYDYKPRPAVAIPPVNPIFLAHLFNCKRHHHGSDQVLATLPKVVDARELTNLIHCVDNDHQEVGWGIQVREGYHSIRALLLAASLMCITALPVILAETQIGRSLSSYALLIPILMLCWMIWLLTQVARNRPPPLTCQIRTVQEDNISRATLEGWLSIIVPIARRAYARWHNVLTYGPRWCRPEQPQGHVSKKRIKCNDCGHIFSTHVGVIRTRANEGNPQESTSDEDPEVAQPSVPGEFHSFGSQRNDNGNGDEGHDSEHDEEPLPVDDEPDLEAAELYVHVIMRAKGFAKKQVPIRVTSFSTDYEFFVELNRVYRQHRGSWRPLTSLKGLRLTKYRLYNQENVHSLYDPSRLEATMPDLANRPPEYSFSYRPPLPIPDPPLLDDDQLLHMFHHPRGQISSNDDGEVFEQECYNRLPKRRGILKYSTNQGYPTGYGLEFVESFNWQFFLYCELFILLVDLLTVFLYAGLTRGPTSTSTAFTIGSWIFVVGQFLYAVVLGLSEKYMTWRF